MIRVVALTMLVAAILAGCTDIGGLDLATSDELAQPGQTIEVRTTVTRKGLSRFFPPNNPSPIRVYRGNELVAEHQPGGSQWSFVTPVTLNTVGEHVIDAIYQRSADTPPEQATCYAYCWDASRVGIVVDLDKTLNVTTAGDRFFGDRPLGDVQPGAADALNDLARQFYICYITALPAEMKEDVRAWLKRQELPGGPIFRWNRGIGNTSYGNNQAAVLANLRQRVPILLIGIGAGGDLGAFSGNGMLSVMIQRGSTAADVPRFDDWTEAYQLFTEPGNQAILADPAKMLDLHLRGGAYMEK